MGCPDPGRAVDAVGDPEDVVIGDPVPGRVGGHRVELADGVGAVGEAQREGGHVELAAVAVHPDAQLQDAIDGHASTVEQRTGDASDQVRVEALVAGRDGRMDREDAVAPDRGPRVAERRPARHVFSGALREQERRVALVEVPDGGGEAQRPDRPHATDPQDELLVEPHLAAADVQDVRDRPVLVGVLRQVRVEEQHRHAADLGEPDRHGQSAVGQFDRDGQRQAVLVLDAAQRQVRQVVVGVGVLLVAVGIDRLAEVALAIEEPDAQRRAGPCRWPTSCGRRPGRPGRRSRCPATRGGRTPRRSRRSGHRACRRTCAGTSGRSHSPCTGRTRPGRRGTRRGTWRRRAGATIRSGR